MGIKDITPLLGPDLESVKMTITDQNLKEWAENFLVAIDNLHNLKGNSSNIVNRLQSMKGFDHAVFQERLEAKVQRRLASELDGSHYRLLVLKWKDVILPGLHSVEIDLVALTKLFQHLGEVCRPLSSRVFLI